jgi:MFS family permease
LDTEQIGETAASGWRATFRALRHRNFRLFTIGQLISLTGTWMQNVALAWLVYRLTHSELMLGTAAFCTHAPILFLGPLGGLAADRWPRLRIVRITQVLAMVQAGALAALTLAGSIRVWHVLALAVMLGTINAFDMPARQALVVHMASKEDLLSAISLNSAMFNLARVAGPALAGFIVAGLGEGACFLINAVSFLAVIGCLAAMRLPAMAREAPSPPWKHMLDGFRYAHRNQPVRALLGVSGAVNLCAAPAMVLAPVFADAIFHRGSVGLGLLATGMGLGAVAGTLGLARRGRVSGLVGVTVSSSLLLAAGVAAFAWSPWFWLSLAVMPLIGFSIMRHNTSANTLLQTIVPDDYRGRTMSLYAMMVVGLLPIGSLAAGALAEHIGARGTVFLGALACLAASLLFRVHVGRYRGTFETRGDA